MRGVLLAKGPDSSFGGVPAGYCPDEVHMEEEEVQVKVQAQEEEIEKHTKGTRWGKKGKNKRSSRTHGWLWGWDEACTNSWAMQCDVQQWVRVHCMRKSDVWGVLSTHSVSCSRLLSAVNETYCNKQFFKMNWTHDVSQFRHEPLEEEGCHLWYWWKGIGSALSWFLGGSGSWLWLRLGSLIEVASLHSCPICLIWDTNVFDISGILLWIGGRSSLPVPIYSFRCTSARSSQCKVANHENWVS